MRTKIAARVSTVAKKKNWLERSEQFSAQHLAGNFEHIKASSSNWNQFGTMPSVKDLGLLELTALINSKYDTAPLVEISSK